MATITDGMQPVCQNCHTSTTPLWRRDEGGSVLCNACGLFLKLHGRPRPPSLKTDVIKSRNRVKSTGHGPKKRSLFDSNGYPLEYTNAPPPPFHTHLQQHRRVSQKDMNGDHPRSLTPPSRTGTPGTNHHTNIAPQHLFDGVSLTEHNFQHSPSLPALHPMRQPSPGSTTSLLDRHLEPPASYEHLQQSNTQLKTRVSELEVINGLFKDRVQQLTNNVTEESAIVGNLRQELSESRRREDDLKRKVDDLEREIADLREHDNLPPSKRLRLSDGPEYPDPPQPL
ncbi:hypothetical protein MMC25_005740 [Agyrium rufum]|nr:hypothetical protein [Agyrium rufum]